MRRGSRICTLIAALTLGLAAAGGCTPRVSSNITVGGQPLNVVDCNSGQRGGFVGVDLLGAAGTKLRLIYTPAGQAQAMLFAKGAQTAQEIGICGPLVVEQQSSRINRVYNVKGEATLSCGSAATRIEGRVTFENCH